MFVCTDIIRKLFAKMNSHKEAPAKFIPVQGGLLSPRKKTRPDSFVVLSKNSDSEMLYDHVEQPKSNVSSKD